MIENTSESLDLNVIMMEEQRVTSPESLRKTLVCRGGILPYSRMNRLASDPVAYHK
jgi:hypothetical protein